MISSSRRGDGRLLSSIRPRSGTRSACTCRPHICRPSERRWREMSWLPRPRAALSEAGVFALWLLGKTEAVSAVLVPRPENERCCEPSACRRPSRGSVAHRPRPLVLGRGMDTSGARRAPRRVTRRGCHDRAECGTSARARRTSRLGATNARGWRLCRAGGRLRPPVVPDEGLGEEPLVLVDVLDGTAMPSGKRRRYFLGFLRTYAPHAKQWRGHFRSSTRKTMLRMWKRRPAAACSWPAVCHRGSTLDQRPVGNGGNRWSEMGSLFGSREPNEEP